MGQHFYKDLIIGDTSQVAKYMPREMIRVSSRYIPGWVYEREWDRVYICFAEQRTIYAETREYRDAFYSVNVDKTLQCIRNIKSNKTIVFSTSELWNQVSGGICLNTPFCFKENYYTDSKLILTRKCRETEKVIIAYPFNFNSIYRNENFLFGKIFSSLKTGTPIAIGNTHFYRDILHAKYVANTIVDLESDIIIGSGRLVYVNDYIRDLYKSMNLIYEKYVSENLVDVSESRPVFWLDNKERCYLYEDLLTDSVRDLKNE